MAFTTEQIRDYLTANPGMTDAQIAADMDRFGVTASQVSAATGVPVSDVMSRYEAATGTTALPFGMFSTPGVVGAPTVAAPAPAPVTISDYEGKLYNPDILRNLYSQIVPNVDLSQLHGGVYNTSGESIGFNYDVGSQILAPILGDRAPTSTEQLVLDMARYLNNRGITDLSQLTPEMAGRFGETYTGGGGTAYNVSFNPDGTPTFGTTGFKTSDKDKILLALAAGATLFGIPGLTNGLLSSGSAGAAGAAGAEALGSGAWLGEGIASGIPAWDAAALSAGNTLAGVSPALLDAQFIAADAAQLAAQTGNNVAAIQQNLIAAGVDPIVAATAADAAALGLTGSELITTIAGAGQTGAGLFTGGSAADLALGGITTTTGAPAGSTVPGGGVPTGGGGGTTTTTGGLPPGVTDTITKVLTNPNTLINLLGLFGGGALGGGSPSGPGSVPTQGIPMNTPEYFNQVQGFLNQYLPGQMPNQAQYLQNWYGTGGGMSPDTSVLQQVGLMPNVPTTPPVSAPPQTPATTEKSVSQTILDYLNTSTTLTDAEIASFMDSAGVSAAQMSAATGVPLAEVMQRYEAATGRPAFPAGMFS